MSTWESICSKSVSSYARFSPAPFVFDKAQHGIWFGRWDHQTWWDTQQTCRPFETNFFSTTWAIGRSIRWATQAISTLDKSFWSTSVTCHIQGGKWCFRMRSLSQPHHQLGSPSSWRALKLETLKCFKEKAITSFCNPFLLHGGGSHALCKSIVPCESSFCPNLKCFKEKCRWLSSIN